MRRLFHHFARTMEFIKITFHTLAIIRVQQVQHVLTQHLLNYKQPVLPDKHVRAEVAQQFPVLQILSAELMVLREAHFAKETRFTKII